MRITRSALFALLATLAMVAAACGDSGATTTAATAPPATTAPTTPATTGATTGTTAAGTTAPPTTIDAFQAEWDSLVAAAQAEGELVMVLSTNNAASQTAVYERFGETFGINMVYAVGSTSEMNSRVLAERSQDVYEVDVVVMGTSAMTGFMEASAMTPLAPLLIDPSIQDRSLWHLSEFPWIPTDPDQAYVSEYLLRNEPNIMRMFYNTDVITEDVLAGIDSWMDFVDDPRWQGRIVIANVFDESSDGTSTDLGRLQLAFGTTFFDRLFNENPPDVVATGDARTIVDGIARGEWDLCFLCDIVTADATQAAADGLPIAQLKKTFAEGPATDLTGHFGVFDRAKNPSAAKLFANWILGQDGQAAVNELMDVEVSAGVTALRKDVPQGNIPDETWSIVTAPGYVAAIPSNEVLSTARDEAHAYVIQLGVELGLTTG